MPRVILTGTSDRSTSEYIGKNIAALVNLKLSNQPLPPELSGFIENNPKKLREQLTQWGVLDSRTNAQFEKLVVYEKVKARNSKRDRFDVKGGHVYGWQKSLEANERSPRHIRESVAKHNENLQIQNLVKDGVVFYSRRIFTEQWQMTTHTGTGY